MQAPEPTAPKRNRKLVFLRALVFLLDQPKRQNITFETIGKQIGVDRTTLRKIMPSKLKLCSLLMDFIEENITRLTTKIYEPDGFKKASHMVRILLAFSEKNPGLTRIMTGDSLITSDPDLTERLYQFHERFEHRLKTHLGDRHLASMMMKYALGSMHQYVLSGFTKKPSAAPFPWELDIPKYRHLQRFPWHNPHLILD